jgi:hypothetical protein
VGVSIARRGTARKNVRCSATAGYAARADLPPGLRSPHVLRNTFCTAIAEREGVDVVAESRRPRRRGHQQALRHRHGRAPSAIDYAFGVGTFARGWGE